MKRYLVIEKSIVKAVVPKEGDFELSDHEGYYDTVVADYSGKYKVGDVYTLELFQLYNATLEELKEKQKALLSIQRKEKEAEPFEHRGIYFSGAKEERASLKEALDEASAENLLEFEVWKDSLNKFHNNVPVELLLEGQGKVFSKRRSLLSEEATLVKNIDTPNTGSVDEDTAKRMLLEISF